MHCHWAERYKAKFETDKRYKGLVCSVCWDKDMAEPSQNSGVIFPAVLALIFVQLAFGLLYLGGTIGLSAEKSFRFVGTLVEV